MTNFRTLPEYPGYEFHEDGRIRGRSGRFLAPSLGKKRYLRVYVLVGGVFRERLWHALICEAFHGPRPTPKHQVRHLDGNALNNAATNLKWGTSAENHADQMRHGTRWDNRGEKHPLAKLTRDQVQEIREKYATGDYFQRELAEEYGISRRYVGDLVNGIGWNEKRSYESEVG